MDDKVISITLWGNGSETGKWIEWYDDIKEIMNNLGYKQTHIAIKSKSYTSGKVLTVARKEKEILAKMNDGEVPLAMECISAMIKEVDYNPDSEQMIVSVLKKYINSEGGEIYSALRSDAPFVYAATRDVNNLKSYELIKKI